MKNSYRIRIIILILICVIYGIYQSFSQTITAKLVAGYTDKLFVTFVSLQVVFIILWTCQRISCKSTYMFIDAKSKVDYYEKIFNSKVSSINKTTVGTITDVVSKISVLKAEMIVTSIANLQVILPFLVMVYNLRCHLMALLVTVCAMSISALMHYFGNALLKYEDNESKYRAAFSSIAVDSFNNIKTIKYCNKKEFIMDKLLSSQKDYVKYSVSITKRVWEGLATAVAISATVVNVFSFRDNMEVLAYLMVSEWIVYNVIDRVVTIIDDLVQLRVNSKKLKELDGSDNAIKIDMPKSIHVYGDFGYKESSMFQIEDFYIRRCERYLVTGESGQGKSSFANLIVGAMPIADMQNPNVDTFYVYQETDCLNDTLRNNITFGDTSITDDEIEVLIKDLRMDNWFYSLKDGLDTLVGERGCTLSSGLKQRVNILRTVFEMRRHPNKMFILDEITSNLDEVTKQAAINVLDRECHSTLIVISHNEGFDKVIDNHIVVEDHTVKLLK